MPRPGQAQKKIFKQIFADGWVDFKCKVPRNETVDEVVKKMLGRETLRFFVNICENYNYGLQKNDILTRVLTKTLRVLA